jgi:hypothetical protein
MAYEIRSTNALMLSTDVVNMVSSLLVLVHLGGKQCQYESNSADGCETRDTKYWRVRKVLL